MDCGTLTTAKVSPAERSLPKSARAGFKLLRKPGAGREVELAAGDVIRSSSGLEV
jgi:hypothetical protein